ncbi:MAG: ATP-dependent Clp protease proteolytic subunit [Candidatus Hydrogenedentes bacterium]|nr:ATP-dependent Clp protease proteolytic subunit [Candidatus Hydrogenedentota bacterium]
MVRFMLIAAVAVLIYPFAAAQDAGDEASPVAPDAGPVAADAGDAPAATARDNEVVVCPIEGMIDDGVQVLVERAVEEAAFARAIIFVIDTPGGRVDSCIRITDAITNASCPSIAYVRGMGAISAGAIISFSCDDIIMSDTAPIGAAQPVIPTTEGMLPTGEKEVSFLRATAAALAEANGHNPHLAQAMVDKDIELIAVPRKDGTYDVVASNVFEGDGRDGRETQPRDPLEKAIDDLAEELPEPIAEPLKDVARELAAERRRDREQPEPAQEAEPAPVGPDGSYIMLARGKLLTLTPSAAKKYGLIRATANNVNDVMREFGYGDAQQHLVEATWSERLFRWLTSPTVAGILLMLGVGGLYFEVKTPGFGVPGIIALICFSLFFGARAVIGLSEWVDLLLVLVGLGLILVEIFLLPGFGVAGIAGIACLLAGLYMSFTFNDFTWPQYSWEFDRLADAGKTFSIATVAFVLFLVLVWKLLPRTPLYGWVVLLHAQDAAAGYTVQTAEEVEAAIGLTGVATSPLRPAGRGRFGNKNYPVVTRAAYVARGTPIVITEAEGNRYVVDVVKDAASTEDKA